MLMLLNFKINTLLYFMHGNGMYQISRKRVFAYFAALLGFAVVLSSLEPSATKELSFPLALSHWIIHLLSAIIILVLLSLVAVRLGIPDILAVVISVLLLPLCLAPISLGIETVMTVSTGRNQARP